MTSNEERIYLTRLDRFAERLKPTIIPQKIPLSVSFAPCDGEMTFDRHAELDWRTIEVGETWGRNRAVGWFRLAGTIPEDWHGQLGVARIDVGGEGLVFNVEGRMLGGISNGSVFDHDFNRDVVRLFDNCRGGEAVQLVIEATASGLFGLFTEPDPAGNATNRYGSYEAKLNAAELGLFDSDAWALWLDAEVVRDLLKVLPNDSPRWSRLLRAATEMIDAYSRGSTAADSRAVLADELNRPATASSMKVAAVGHAHIDTAWLWPVRETIRKCARTFSSQLALIERYPDYVFGASQAQHYAFVKEHYPELFERVKQAIADGRWEVQGGMWVEADCNLISGESMIRQILHGKNFFRDEFGIDVANLWLPDVFGYSAALPQILKKSGIDYFVTQKMSWNQFNEFPYHTFVWQGIDGSEVLTHFPSENNYNSTLRPDSLIAAEKRFHESGRVDEFLSLFGVGDGGGGPKEEHIEFGRRQADLEGSPKVRFDTAGEFFARLNCKRETLPRWVGELYLELHRGTLTTQARTKLLNRRLENSLRATEMICSCLPFENYPSAELDRLWKTLLRNQFHDIIPGSSITEVYRTTETELGEIKSALDALGNKAAAELFVSDSDRLVLFNPNHYPFRGTVVLPEGWSGAKSDDPIVTVAGCQGEEKAGIAQVMIEPYSFATLDRAKSEIAVLSPSDGLYLENDLIRYEFSDSGRLVRAYDKEAEREIVPDAQAGNILTLYDDRPNDWDAWDIDIFYEAVAVAEQSSVEAPVALRGPVRQTLRLKLTIGNSTVDQVVALAEGSRRLDFVTTIDWHESHRMLRVSFPVDIVADQASFDIQYGHVRRPTHRNTTWDLARFEVAGHKYADLSEPDYGVALLNDAKYGYRVHGNILDLCLLRAPTYPDPDADRGEHKFTYSLLPHRGDLVHSGVMAEATGLNQPPLMFVGQSAGDVRLPVRCAGESVSMEVLKRAEKEDCLVCRLVETGGGRAIARLDVVESNIEVRETDLLEWHDGVTLDLNKNPIIELRPFEIRTLKVSIGRQDESGR